MTFFATSPFCQFSKGDQMIGANIGAIFFNNTKADIKVGNVSSSSDTRNVGLNINPSMGWFISEKIAVGATLLINPNSQKITYELGGTTYQEDKSKTFNIGAGGFVRNYFSGRGEFLPFGQLSVNAGISSLNTDGFYYGSLGTMSYKLTYEGESSAGFFMNSSLSLGFTRKFNEFTALDLFVGYTYSYSKNTFNKTTLVDHYLDGTIDEQVQKETVSKYTGNGIQIGAGVQVFLKGKK